jgi:hypothetical protein
MCGYWIQQYCKEDVSDSTMEARVSVQDAIANMSYLFEFAVPNTIESVGTQSVGKFCGCTVLSVAFSYKLGCLSLLVICYLDDVS